MFVNALWLQVDKNGALKIHQDCLLLFSPAIIEAKNKSGFLHKKVEMLKYTNEINVHER